MPRLLTSLFLCALVVSADGAELKFAGVLANSGESGDSIVSFPGKQVACMGPVLDADNTIWERGGSKQLNRYSLDGRLLARFDLPDESDRNDQLTLAGKHLVMRIQKIGLYPAAKCEVWHTS